MLRPRLRIPLRPGALTPAISSATTSAALRPMACRARAMHSLTPLTYDLNGEVRTTGLGKLMSVTAYNIAWYQYQSHLLAKLNGLIAGLSTFFVLVLPSQAFLQTTTTNKRIQ